MSRRVKIDDRQFIVDFGDDGEPVRIKERKMYGKYPLDGWYNASFWHAKHHAIGKPTTIVARILAATREGAK